MSDGEALGRVRLVAVSGGVWPVRPVLQQPEAALRQWQVYEVEGQARHLIGWCDADREGRVTSAVAAFDPATGRCRTESGRVYELRGPPGWNGDAQYVWARWRELYRVSTCRNVTLEIETAMAQAWAAKGEGA